METSIDLIEAILESLSQSSEHFEGTTVYLDSGCAECFQSVGAFSLFLDHGARAVCSLENCSALDMAADWNLNYDDPPRKIVIMTSRLLSEAHRHILRCLKIHGRNVHHCTIFTSISEIGQSACPDSPLGPDAFREYSVLLVEDYEETLRRVRGRNNPSGEEQDGSDDSVNPRRSNSATTLLETSQGNLDGGATGLNLKLTVSVHHFPMMFCPLSPSVFVLPSQGSIAQSVLSSKTVDGLCPRLPPLSTEHSSSSSSYSDEVPPPGATMTAHFLYHLALRMDLKLEIFSHGSLARKVGKILTDMSSLYDVGRRKRSAGILIIDRTLDLLTPCCHGDSLIDHIFSSSYEEEEEEEEERDIGTRRGSQMSRTIRAFEAGYNSGVPSSEAPKDIDFLRGSIPTAFNLRGTGFPDNLLERRTRDGVRAMRTIIEEALFEEGITVNEKSDLRSMVSMMMTTQRLMVRGRGMSRVAASADIAMRSINSERHDAFLSAERILWVNADDGSQSLATQVIDLINRASMDGPNRIRLLSLEDTLLLAVTAYILGGKSFPASGRGSPFTFLEEDTMKEAIVEAILRNPPKKEMKFLLDMREEIESYTRKEENEEWGNWGDDDDDDDDDDVRLRLRERVDTFFGFLHRLARSMRTRRSGSRCETRSLLHELLTGVFSGADVDDLEHHSSAVGRLFKSGFMKFGLAPVKTRLVDHSIIIIFIVGGLNGVEVADAREVLLQYRRPDVQLILGGTTVLTPDCMFDMLFGNSSFV